MKTQHAISYGFVLLVMVLAVQAPPAGAQGAPGPGDRFFDELTVALAREGWSEEEIRSFSADAARLDWALAAGSDPGITAFALEYARGVAPDNPPGIDAAILAFEVAVVSREMSRIGLSPLDVALAAVEGARAAVRAAGRSASTGETPGRAGEAPGRESEAQGRVRAAIARGARNRIREVPVGREAAGRGVRRAGSGPQPHAGPPENPVRAPVGGPPDQLEPPTP